MARSFYPETLSECQLTAEGIVALQGNPQLNEMLALVLSSRTLPAAQTFLMARTAHRRAQTTLRTAHRETVAANEEADNALKMLEASAKYQRGDESAAALRSARGGMALSELTGLPNHEQPAAVSDYLDRLADDITAGRIPRNHVETVSESNARLRAAVQAEASASGNRLQASAAMSAARLSFLNHYRPFVRMVLTDLGEAVARTLLPSFDHSASSTGEEDTADMDSEVLDAPASGDSGAGSGAAT